MSKGNILLVEDKNKMRGLISKLIKIEGYTVYESMDMRSARQVLKKRIMTLLFAICIFRTCLELISFPW